MTDVDDLLGRAESALARLPAASPGVSATVEGIPCASYRVAEPWATQAKAMVPPRPAALDAALDWLVAHAHGAGQWTVMTRQKHAERSEFAARGLRPWVERPTMVLGQASLLSDTPRVSGLRIVPASSAAEFLVAYGADRAALVSDGLVAHPAYHHLVGEIDGRPVASAAVREVADTAYVFGVTVVPECRGKGIGSAMTAAAARLGLAAHPRVVWLSAQRELHPMYRRLGFRPAGVHVLLRRS